MARNQTFLLIVGGLLLSVGAGALFHNFVVRSEDSGHLPQLGTATGESAPRVAPVMPDLRILVERMGQNGGMSLTPEQMAEARRIEQEQIDQALQWLSSADSAERVMGAEQLGAYLTPQAQKALTVTLGHDPSADVRIAAAGSLSGSQSPDEGTIRNLLAVFGEEGEDVQRASLATLETYLGIPDLSTRRRQQILKGLARLSKSRKLDRETRATLNYLLEH